MDLDKMVKNANRRLKAFIKSRAANASASVAASFEEARKKLQLD